MKWIDIPPVWLIASLALAWGLRGPALGLSFDFPATSLLAGLLVGAGLVLMLLAVTEMRKHRTTVMPHLAPTALVQSGIFRRSRNPIYLGDTLILTGLILYWNAPLALPLIPAFVWLIDRRFVRPEEARLRAAFGPAFARYCETTRRWL